MRLSSSDVLADLVSKFLGDSIYSESSSISPELASDVISLSGLVVNLGVAVGPSVGRARFKFILPLLMTAGMAVSEVAVSVSAWAAWVAPALDCKVGQPDPLVRTGVVNYRASG